MSEAFEGRLAALEAAFEEVKKNKVIAVRGPAGPIDAAVANAREALAEDLANTLKEFAELRQLVKDSELKSQQVINDAYAKLNERFREYASPESLNQVFYRALHEFGLMTDGGIGELLLNEVQKAVLSEVKKELSLAPSGKKL